MYELTNKILKQFRTVNFDNIDKLMMLYSPDCEFFDPFHSVCGKEKIKLIYLSMFQNLHDVSFSEVNSICSDSKIILDWNFNFKVKSGGKPTSIPGISCLSINNNSLIHRHRDYWDSSLLFAEYFPMNIPINWIKKKIKNSI